MLTLPVAIEAIHPVIYKFGLRAVRHKPAEMSTTNHDDMRLICYGGEMCGGRFAAYT
jgi:hypothetical protein